MTQKLQIFKSKMLWIIILVIALVIQGLVITGLFLAQQSDMGFNAAQNFQNIVYHGRQDTYRPVVVDAPTDRVYLPEMRFSVPFNHVTREWQYSFAGDIGNDDSLITLTTNSMIDSFNNSAYPNTDAINEFDGCSLLAEVGFVGGEGINDRGIITVDLDDSRQLAIIRHDSDGACENESAKRLIDEAVEQLKLAESY